MTADYLVTVLTLQLLGLQPPCMMLASEIRDLKQIIMQCCYSCLVFIRKDFHISHSILFCFCFDVCISGME